jgi:hypothetical protein
MAYGANGPAQWKEAGRASPQNNGVFCSEFGGYSSPRRSLDSERRQSRRRILPLSPDNAAHTPVFERTGAKTV